MLQPLPKHLVHVLKLHLPAAAVCTHFGAAATAAVKTASTSPYLNKKETLVYWVFS
ncbi:hypothetical protein SK128_024023 [Halocaridina rubra]|uniref:Uncharacterized protein n=1 Tax=Halocaridina rubra TaxID=373956 RepID=A0AAN8WI45_HALRR